MRLEWISASEGDKFARTVSEFTEQVRALGPLDWSTQFDGNGSGGESTRRSDRQRLEEVPA